MPYVDGFVLAVPKDNMEAYKALATTACAIWMEHGALDYVECIGDDVPYGELTSFPRAVMAKEDEIVVFSWIVYRDRETRDAVNKKVMADPRLKLEGMPFDGKRMIYGGFTTLLRASDPVKGGRRPAPHIGACPCSSIVASRFTCRLQPLRQGRRSRA